MAKIHKVEMYIVDSNDDFENIGDYFDYLDNCKYSLSTHITKTQTKDFKWDDNAVVNKYNAQTEDYNKFFKSIKEE